MKRNLEWRSSGYIYDNGDIPQCSYCTRDGITADIYETAHSGILICDNKECALEYVGQNCELLICSDADQEVV